MFSNSLKDRTKQELSEKKVFVKAVTLKSKVFYTLFSLLTKNYLYFIYNIKTHFIKSCKYFLFLWL